MRRLARAVGLDAMVEYYPLMTREDRRSLFLHRAISERLLGNPDRVLATARTNLGRMRSAADSPSQLLREWEVMLGRPPEALASLLTDPDPWARELRHVTPFAGVLSAAERADTYRAFAADERETP